MTEETTTQKQAQQAYASMQEALEAQKQAIEDRKKTTTRKFGNVSGKPDNLKFCVISDPDAVITDPDVIATFGKKGEVLKGQDLMDAMYPLYLKSFPIPTEQSSVEALNEAMRANKDDDLQNSNQRTQEAWTFAYDPAKKEIIGGYNTMTISTAGTSTDIKKEADAGSILIYTFVDPDYRDFNLSSRMASVSENAARNFAAETHNDGRIADTMTIIQAAEQNDPRALTPKDIVEDSGGAGISQCYRRKLFNQNYQFGQADFNYVQPGLEGKAPCEGLNLVFRLRPPPTSAASPVMHDLCPQTLKFILENFIEKSVIGSDEYKQDETWQGMERELDTLIEQKSRIAIHQDIDFMSLEPQIYQKIEQVINAQSFNPSLYEDATMEELGVGEPAKLQQAAPSLAKVAMAQESPAFKTAAQRSIA